MILFTDEELGEKAIFAGKDTMKTVMLDTTVNLKSIQSQLHEVYPALNRLFNPCSMTKGRWYVKENNEKKRLRLPLEFEAY